MCGVGPVGSVYLVQGLFPGVVVAVCGMEPEDDRGKFHVEDLCFQDLPQQVPRPALEQDKYVQYGCMHTHTHVRTHAHTHTHTYTHTS